ncbi:hypothetical protein Tco_0491390 [Tanacetum coccineum]
MEMASRLTQKHLFITTYYYDKHGVPPMKCLFKVAMLDTSPNLLVHGEHLEIWDYQLWYIPSKVVLQTVTIHFEVLPEVLGYLDSAIWKNLGYSEWSTPAGLKFARENLQSRVKEEDSITDVENAIFDLGVVDSLCFLFIDQRVFIGMITKFIKFIELNFSVITYGFDIKVCMLKGLLDPLTLAPKDKNNRKTHIYYLKHTLEQAAILREIVEQAKSLNPSDSASYSVLSRSTKSSRSKSTDNTKNDKILQISSSNQKKNKVEVYSRIVESSLNKSNYVVEPSGNANVQHSKLNTNSELISKSKSVKKAKKKEEWKPTEKHMTGDRSQLTNFINKFLDTVKFDNDQIAKIMSCDHRDYLHERVEFQRISLTGFAAVLAILITIASQSRQHGDQPLKTSSIHATTQDSRDSLEGTNGNEGDQVQTPHDSPLLGGQTSNKAEGAREPTGNYLFIVLTLSNSVLPWNLIKDAQAAEIDCIEI